MGCSQGPPGAGVVRLFKRDPMRKYVIDEGWRYHLSEAWLRYVVCRVKGHVPMTKFGGTVLCRRCHAGLG